MLPLFSKHSANREILAFIAAHPMLSAHSDVTSELALAADGLAHAQEYCPDYASYRYVVLHNDAGVIFALAYGMRGFALRLPAKCHAEARHDGAEGDGLLYGQTREDAPGGDWLVFNAFPPELSLKESRAILGRWCRQAHLYAAV